MTRKKLLMLLGSVCLALVLAVLLLPACAPATPEEAAEEIAALEAELDDLEGDVAAEKTKTKKLQDEIAELRKPAEVYEWRCQAMDVPVSMTIPSYRKFFDRLREASDGQIDVTLYSAGELVPSPEIVHGLDAGTIEFGMTAGSYYVGEIESCNLYSACMPPWVLTSTQQWVEMYMGDGGDLFSHKPLGDLIRAGYAEHGVYYLGELSISPCTFWSREPLYSVSDFEGLKMRLWGGPVADTFERLGVKVAFIPKEEIYTSLATGVVDAAGTGIDDYEATKSYEVAKYLYMPGFLDPGANEVLMSMGAWNEVPQYQALIKAAMGELQIETYKRGWWFTQEIFMRCDEWGVTITTWSDEDIAEMVEAAGPSLDEMATRGPRSAEGIQIIKDYLRFVGKM